MNRWEEGRNDSWKLRKREIHAAQEVVLNVNAGKCSYLTTAPYFVFLNVIIRHLDCVEAHAR